MQQFRAVLGVFSLLTTLLFPKELPSRIDVNVYLAQILHRSPSWCNPPIYLCSGPLGLTCSHAVTCPPVKTKTIAVMYSIPQTKRASAPRQRLTVASQGRQTSSIVLRQRTMLTMDRAPTCLLIVCEETEKWNSSLMSPTSQLFESLKKCSKRKLNCLLLHKLLHSINSGGERSTSY